MGTGVGTGTETMSSSDGFLITLLMLRKRLGAAIPP